MGVRTGVIALAAAIFALDLVTELGVAGGVPYVAPVAMSFWSRSRRWVAGVVIAVTGLTLLGYLLAPAGGEAWKVLLNRTYAIFAIWVVGLFAVQRMRLEESLQESETRLHAVVETASGGLVIHDAEGRTVWCNSAYIDLLGYSTEELKDVPLAGLFPAEDREDLLRDFGSALRGRSLHGRRSLVTKSGSIIEVEVTTLSFDEPGQPRRVLSDVRDVTAEAENERALQRSEAHLRAVFDTAPTGLAFFDYRNNPIRRNRAFAEMLGYTPEEFSSVNPTEFIAPEDIEDGRRRFDAIMGDGAGDETPLARTFVHKDGHAVEVTIQQTPLDVNGQRVGVVRVVRDISGEVGFETGADS